MEWLLDTAEKYRSQLRQGPFFKDLANANRPDDVRWVHQLVHQSREFTQALCPRCVRISAISPFSRNMRWRRRTTPINSSHG
jgi:hypothetical protein